MQIQLISVKCINGHQCQKLCTLKTCTRPSSICNSQHCQYYKIHNKCLTNTDTQSLVNILTSKAKLQSLELEKLILGTTNNLIKLLTQIKEQYLSANDQQIRLSGDQKALFNLLKFGPIQQLKPAFVNSCIQGLNSKKEEDQLKILLNHVKTNLNKIEKQVTIKLEEIKKCWKIQKSNIIQSNVKEINLFKFQIGQNYKDIVEVSHQGKYLKRIHESNRSSISGFFYSLLSPSISQSHNKLKLRVIKKKQNLYIGAARKQILTQSQFQYPQNGKGLCIINSNGFVCNALSQNQHKTKQLFKFIQGNFLQLEYIPTTRELVIKNLTERTEFKMSNVGNQSLDLCFCVGTSHKQDQFEIVK